MSVPVKTTTYKKHKAVYQFFEQQFEVKRIRYDDCIKITAEKFFYSTSTIEDIIRRQRA
jgi:hypothetical protein